MSGANLQSPAERLPGLAALAHLTKGDTEIAMDLDVVGINLQSLAETFGGYRLPSGYLGAIRQAICQPLSPSTREV